MQNKINQYIDVAMALRQQRRKTARNLCALALLVALGIFWQMRITGIAMSGEACCGKPEHTHTEACLGEKQLVCGYPEESEISQTSVEPQLNCQLEAHSHGDACYTTQQVLVCGEDHEHTDACYTQEKVLTCEKPEHIHDTSCWEPLPEPHVHTETCYEQSYICGLEAHTHTTVCYSDPNADLETARD